MAGLRGDLGALNEDDREVEIEDNLLEAPPAAIGQDERRMQVRAYNHWAGLLGSRNYPAIGDLQPAELTDFGPYSVLLDFSDGLENPGIAYLGSHLAQECSGEEALPRTLADVPSRSLLSRITDHYMQILANRAPIGFEAEFVNQRNVTILYRGILLPYSSDDATIDFIYGVINWRELADQQATEDLLLEFDQVLESKPRHQEALTDWADGPGAIPANDIDPAGIGSALPRPTFGLDPADEVAPAGQAAPQADMGLEGWLASAREMAAAAHMSEDRSRGALYDAVGRAHDFALAAAKAPAEFAEMLARSGLSAQQRAPMTPIVKLVFGPDYDKTRLTEYAAVLAHARRLQLARGALADFLRAANGGLKGVVQAERQLRREESGQPARKASGPPPALARKLRALAPASLADIDPEGSEFALVMIRRGEGEVEILGEVPEDTALMERAARRLTS